MAPACCSSSQKTAADTYASSRRLQEIGKNYQPKATVSEHAAGRRGSSWPLSSSTPTSAPASSTSPSTASTRTPPRRRTHANLMTQVSGAMTAFFKDLAARGHRDRILMMTFSEFGRRVKENGSKGTDHGTAAPMLLRRRQGQRRPGRQVPQPGRPGDGQSEIHHGLPPRLRHGPRPVARRLQHRTCWAASSIRWRSSRADATLASGGVSRPAGVLPFHRRARRRPLASSPWKSTLRLLH